MNKNKLSEIEIIRKEKEKNLEQKMERLMSSHLKDFQKLEKIYWTDAKIEDLMKYNIEYEKFSDKWMVDVGLKMEEKIEKLDFTGAEEILQKAIIQNKNYLDVDKYFLHRHANQDQKYPEVMAYFLIKVGGDELLPLLKQ